MNSKKLNKLSSVPDQRLELLFRHLGLAEKQAKLYRLLVETGEERPAFLAHKSGFKRGNVYALLRDMQSRGLVVEFDKGKVKYFRPEPPERLAAIVDERQKDVAIAQDLAADIVPSLTFQWKESLGKPLVRHFAGEEGVRKALEDIYAPGKAEIVGCVGLESPHEELYRHIVEKLMPLRVRRKIMARALNTDSPRARELQKNDAKHLREIFLSDGDKYPLPAEIDVYEDKIAFLSFAQKDFVGLVLENRDFARTLASVFKMLFDLLRERASGLTREEMEPEAS